MGHDTDVFVVGGGPAGLAAAIAARAKGFSVIVADGGRPPITKACGEGLLPDTLAALRKLGIFLGPSDGSVLRGIRFDDGRSAVNAEFRSAFGLGVRREVLHQRMVERAQACGVTFAWNTPVSGLWKEGVLVGANHANCGNTVKARWVVGADGSRSRVRRWAGLESVRLRPGRFARRQHFRARPWSDFTEVHWQEDAQAYVTPVSPCEICVAFITNRPDLRGHTLQRFPALAARLGDAPLAGPERGAMTRTSALARVSRGNIVLIGDASGTVDAITGEGLSLGFRQSLALAEGLVSGNLRQYEREHRRVLRRPRFMAALLLFLSRSYGIRRRTLQVMHAAPHIFDCLLAYHVGETRPLELAATGAQFGWRFLTA
jgi:menaquinone-9 beta-reductase